MSSPNNNKSTKEFAEDATRFVEQIIDRNPHLNKYDKNTIKEIISGIGCLIEAAGEEDEVRVNDALTVIHEKLQNDLFVEVGKLTRKLHNSIIDFQNDIGPHLNYIASNEAPQATNQLEMVIKMTDQAAHTVLSLVEEQNSLISGQKIAITNVRDSLDTISPAKPRHDLQILEEMGAIQEKMILNNNQILMAQEFQDLSSQVLKKVITMIGEVQDSLVKLVQMFGVADSLEEQPEAKETTGDNDAGACSQNDIDSILGSFGF